MRAVKSARKWTKLLRNRQRKWHQSRKRSCQVLRKTRKQRGCSPSKIASCLKSKWMLCSLRMIPSSWLSKSKQLPLSNLISVVVEVRRLLPITIRRIRQHLISMSTNCKKKIISFSRCSSTKSPTEPALLPNSQSKPPFLMLRGAFFLIFVIGNSEMRRYFRQSKMVK